MTAYTPPPDVIEAAAKALEAHFIEASSAEDDEFSDDIGYRCCVELVAPLVAADARRQALEEALAVLLSKNRSESIDAIRALAEKEGSEG